MLNQELADIFLNIAELLELKADNLFKIRAYEKAARNIESLNHDIGEIYKSGGIKALENIPGVGAHTALKIEEYLNTGKIKAFNALKHEFPNNFLKLVEIPGMGPKTAILLYKKLGIDSPEKLEKAIKAGKLKDIPGMGAKKEENILRGIELKKKVHGRFLLDVATSHAELLVEELSKLKVADKILPCGSLRRGKETIGDIDLLVVSSHPARVMDAFVGISAVKDVLAKGETKSSVILQNGMQADLRVVEEKSFGAAAHYFTGCKEHNIHLRQLAQQTGWKVSEYGIFRKDKQIGGETEEEMFSKFGFQFIPPELREMRGEFEAAAKGKIPDLIELKDIKGDLHLHTTASDGANTIEEMARAVKALGYEYILITDHSPSTRVAKGFSAAKLLQQIKEVRAAEKNVAGIRILAGSEVDIKPDGSLDYPDEILKQLDLVIIAVHSSFKMPEEKMTNRIIKAMQNKYANIFTHPTGRLIGEREGYAIDMEKVLQAAKENNVAMEINAHPKRLDLTDVHCMRAKELGVKLVINTDAHSTDQLQLMKYGVITARRGWLEAKDVLNTYSLTRLLQSLK
ncbi:MAG: DNA polymerase/3'-5' exonuclease PolX [Candidatus Margulisbacteria bacterium]|nr:DNA polymerase/3'-5' exonuclease PolX [Candidatus Margulisiibacteriota bacterium]